MSNSKAEKSRQIVFNERPEHKVLDAALLNFHTIFNHLRYGFRLEVIVIWDCPEIGVNAAGIYIADTDIVFAKPSPVEEKATEKSYFAVDNKDVILSAFKCAECGSGYIVRLYNASDKAQNAKLTFGIPTKEVFECNLNEEKRGSCEVVNNSVDVRFDKWQIKTFMVL